MSVTPFHKKYTMCPYPSQYRKNGCLAAAVATIALQSLLHSTTHWYTGNDLYNKKMYHILRERVILISESVICMQIYVFIQEWRLQ